VFVGTATGVAVGAVVGIAVGGTGVGDGGTFVDVGATVAVASGSVGAGWGVGTTGAFALEQALTARATTRLTVASAEARMTRFSSITSQSIAR
jgi:hypothetical protein